MPGESDQPERVTLGPWWKPRSSTLAAVRMIFDAGRRRACVLVAIAIVEGLLPALFTLVAGRLVSAAHAAGSQAGDPDDVTRWVLVMAALFVAGQALSGFRFAYSEGFRHMVDGQRTGRVITASMQPPGIAHLEDPRVRDLVQKAGHADWPDPSHFFVGTLGLATARVTALATAAIVAGFRWWLALGLMVAWVTVGRVMRQGQIDAFTGSFGKLRRAHYVRQLTFVDWAAKEVRIFGLCSWLLDAFSRTWTSVMKEVWRNNRGVLSRQARAFVVAIAASVVAFLVVVNAAQRGEIGPGRLVVLVAAVAAVSRIGETNEHTLPFVLGAIALPAVDELERAVAAPRYAPSGDADAEGMPTREIRFEQVGFGYPARPDRLVFDGLDLCIDAGKSLAIVGVNGAGKTTLVKLLSRLHEPTSGRITVDGTPLTELDPESWQRRVAAIFQTFVRYPFSAADNVGFGAVDRVHDRDLVVRAATRVGAADLIDSLPNGWDTVLTRKYVGGADLSGGQWQRIALARALAAVEGGAGILVLDEPTAHLDVRAEVELFDKFLEVTAGSTTILISHRFSTVRRADRIVVLHEGRVVEEGTHADLAVSDGYYSRAFRIQAERYRASDDEEQEQDAERIDEEIAGAFSEVTSDG